MSRKTIVFNEETSVELSNIDFTPKMVATVRQSKAAYKAALEAEQRSQTAEQQKVTENRKCKALVSSLEQHKRKKD